jgi:hypothetical protein
VIGYTWKREYKFLVHNDNLKNMQGDEKEYRVAYAVVRRILMGKSQAESQA